LFRILPEQIRAAAFGSDRVAARGLYFLAWARASATARYHGQGFAAGYPETEKLSEVLLQLNETSLGQLRRDHETGHLGHKIAQASK